MNDNPLKQYFRRPSLYVKLPSNCQYYDDSIIEKSQNNEYPVYPMTAIDEITSRTPDALFNGHAVVEIIKSCIPAIKNPWKINSIDMESIFIAIRVASSGENLDVTSVCPSCKHEGKFGLNLVSMLTGTSEANYSAPLKIRELEILFRPLTFEETNENSMAQYEIQKQLISIENIEDQEEKNRLTNEIVKSLNDRINNAIADTIDYIKTPEVVVVDKNHIKDFLLNCDRQTYNIIKEFGGNLQSKTQLKPFLSTCPECSTEYEQPIMLNISDFFE